MTRSRYKEVLMDIGQIFNDFWTEWGATVISFLTSGVFGAIVVGVVRGIVSRFANKSRSADLTDSQLNAIAERVAKRIANNVLDVDISQVVTDATKEELKEISKTVSDMKTAVTNVNEATALMAKGMSRSKLLKGDESEKLTAAAETLEETMTPKKEHIKVKVESAEVKTDTVKFGG